MILVRGPWYETPGSPDLLFVLNKSMSFPGMFKLWDLYVGAFLRVYPLHSLILLLYFFFVGKSRRGKLVNWVEKASFKKIQRLLEIFEWERHHEMLLFSKNLLELSHSPSPSIIPVIKRHLPVEIVEGEHYVIADFLNLAPGSSSPTKKSETGAVGRELVISSQSGQPSLAREDSGLVRQASKKDDRGIRLERLPFAKKDSRPTPQASKKGRWVPERLKTPRARVEDFVSWVSPISSCPPAREEEEEDEEMADLVHNFGARKHKRGASFKRATGATPRWPVR